MVDSEAVNTENAESSSDILAEGAVERKSGNRGARDIESSETSAARSLAEESSNDILIEGAVESPIGDESRTPRAPAQGGTRRVHPEIEVSLELERDRGVVMGFPGWHLECSAMAMSILGETIDIHTGGIDHIPVHHTNEIAQSEAATGKKLSNFWLHNNHLKSNGTKLSKSLGNSYTLEDIEEKGFSPTDYRMFVLQSHYQNEGNFSFENLQAAHNRLQNWRNIAALRHQTHDTVQNDDEKSSDDGSISLYATSQAFVEALSDDLDTPGALAIIDEAFNQLAAKSLADIHQHALVQLLETIDELLGLRLLETTPDISDDQKQILIERRQAREAKDWKKSDKIRDQLAKDGLSLRDNNTDVIWEYSS